ncbi:MAG: hypothetical protein FWE40_07625 [Oscillospiraceae bacterium]|nr:hypothetical protein [Oscillospiraceae bacterium]
MKKFKAAAIIIIAHGVIEIGGLFAVLPIWLGAEAAAWVPFAPPAPEILIGGVIWGVLRLIGGIGLWKNRKWAFVLAAISCAIAMAAIFEVLPFGLMDAVLGGAALILMLTGYFGQKKILEE